MVIRRVGPLSLAKIFGVTYACMGLFFGILFSSVASLFSAFGASDSMPPMFGLFFGVGAVIVMPVMYGVMGFVGGAVSAFIYNLVAGWLGGIEIDLQ
jgi:hypothetical protein